MYGKIKSFLHVPATPNRDIETVEEFTDACREKNFFEVERIIEEDKSIINRKDSIGETGLIIAIWRNDCQILRKIISYPDLDMSLSNSFGWTAFHCCCNFNRYEILNQLLQHPRCSIGIVQMKDNWANMAKMIAEKKEYIECVRLLEFYEKAFLTVKKDLMHDIKVRESKCYEDKKRVNTVGSPRLRIKLLKEFTTKKKEIP